MDNIVSIMLLTSFDSATANSDSMSLTDDDISVQGTFNGQKNITEDVREECLLHSLTSEELLGATYPPLNNTSNTKIFLISCCYTLFDS